MANENFTWGEERIANELLVKLGISVSPRTVRKYMPKRPGHRGPRGDQTWSTFLKNHANAIVACDFCTVVTINFRVLYVFVLIEHGTRQLIHTNVTENPTADWARQQLREAIPSDHEYRLIALILDAENRFVRVQGRARLGDPQQRAQFKSDDERANGSEGTFQNNQTLIDAADHLIENTGSVDELRSGLTAIIDTIIDSSPAT